MLCSSRVFGIPKDIFRRRQYSKESLNVIGSVVRKKRAPILFAFVVGSDGREAKEGGSVDWTDVALDLELPALINAVPTTAEIALDSKWDTGNAVKKCWLHRELLAKAEWQAIKSML